MQVCDLYCGDGQNCLDKITSALFFLTEDSPRHGFYLFISKGQLFESQVRVNHEVNSGNFPS